MHDYPRECYPADVLMAYGCIARADKALETDHSEIVARGERAFKSHLDNVSGIPCYVTNLNAELLLQQKAYGCSSTLVCIFGAEIYNGKFYKMVQFIC